jgi:hypothetical protein
MVVGHVARDSEACAEDWDYVRESLCVFVKLV